MVQHLKGIIHILNIICNRLNVIDHMIQNSKGPKIERENSSPSCLPLPFFEGSQRCLFSALPEQSATIQAIHIFSLLHNCQHFIYTVPHLLFSLKVP